MDSIRSAFKGQGVDPYNTADLLSKKAKPAPAKKPAEKAMKNAQRNPGVDPYNSQPTQAKTYDKMAKDRMRRSSEKEGMVDAKNREAAGMTPVEAQEEPTNPFKDLEKYHKEYHTSPEPHKAVGAAAMYHQTLQGLQSAVPQPDNIMAAMPPVSAGLPPPDGVPPQEPGAPMPPMPGMVAAAPRIRR